MSRTTRLFLAGRAGIAPPRLLPGESEHARRVLRLKEGDACEGLDGEGHRWPLRIAAAGRDELRLEAVSPPELSPAPGEPGSELPWIELAVSWPRKPRAEEMIGMLVQLGAAAITPLSAAQGGPAPPPAETPERWQKLAREACKQSGRAWMPRFGAPCDPAELSEERPGAVLAMLDPVAGMSLDTWLRSLVPAHADDAGNGLGTAERPIVLAVGPEGGFAPAELDALRIAGATGVRLAPHVLRIETAAVAAMAVAAATFVR